MEKFLINLPRPSYDATYSKYTDNTFNFTILECVMRMKEFSSGDEPSLIISVARVSDFHTEERTCEDLLFFLINSNSIMAR